MTSDRSTRPPPGDRTANRPAIRNHQRRSTWAAAPVTSRRLTVSVSSAPLTLQTSLLTTVRSRVSRYGWRWSPGLAVVSCVRYVCRMWTSTAVWLASAAVSPSNRAGLLEGDGHQAPSTTSRHPRRRHDRDAGGLPGRHGFICEQRSGGLLRPQPWGRLKPYSACSAGKRPQSGAVTPTLRSEMPPEGSPC